MGIEINGIKKQILSTHKKRELIYDNFSMEIGDSEVVGLYGPNGCGKTTLLHMIAGIHKPDAGSIMLNGNPLGVQPISYIFQDYKSSLYPWMTVKQNILFPLTLKKHRKKDMERKLQEWLDFIKIPFSINKYPYELSGGQQQYIAILRGLVAEPAALLMDEPFSAMDYSNTIWLSEKMQQIFTHINIPVVIVAHDLDQLKLITQKIYMLSSKPTVILREEQSAAYGISVGQKSIDNIFAYG